MTTAGTTVSKKGLEYVLDKLLHALDPLLDPVFNKIRSIANWLHNRLAGKKLPRPLHVTEAEFDDMEDYAQTLIVPG